MCELHTCTGIVVPMQTYKTLVSTLELIVVNAGAPIECNIPLTIHCSSIMLLQPAPDVPKQRIDVFMSMALH